MSNIQPTNPTALSRSGPINASTLLCMITQTNMVEMTGFSSPQTRWFAPGVRFVGMGRTGRNDVGAELAWQSSRTRKVLIACSIMVGISFFFAFLLFALVGASHDASNSAVGLRPVAWSAQKIAPNGLWVRSGTNNFFIPSGSHLPNGETLLSTSAEQNRYSTPTGVTTMGVNP